MSRIPPWLLVTAVWAAIYLPALGSFEIKGEEGRRILPGIAMRETGDYVVPRVGGESYFSKPPLVNWMVAASFGLFGVRNEWTARLPSVLCVLAIALLFVTVSQSNLGRHGSQIAALIWLTTFGLIEKGRLIEIEAVYVSLATGAIICWLSWWQQNRSPWLIWVVPWFFLGLGWLAKGPILLLFFYAVVLAVLGHAKQWRQLLHPAHGLGLFIMLGIFSAWAVPFAAATGSGRVIIKWSNQISGRAALDFFHPAAWISTMVRAFLQFLPWLIFWPLLRFNRFENVKDAGLARALTWSFVVPLVLISLTPSTAPRYSLPVLAPFCWLMTLGFISNGFVVPPRLGIPPAALWSRVAMPLVVTVSLGALIGYPLAAMRARDRLKVKNVAEQINAIVPPDAILYAVAPGYQPLLFYIRARVVYAENSRQIPPTAEYVLARSDGAEEVMADRRWPAGKVRPLVRLTDYRGETIILLSTGSP